MARERAHVLASWSADRVPTLALPLPAGASLMDTTGQQNVLPSPNVLVVEVWADSTFFDALPPGDVTKREPFDQGGA